MKLLASYLKHHRGLMALALALAATNQIFSLLDPLILRFLIDTYAMRFAAYTPAEFFRGAGALLGAAIGVAFVSRVAKNFQDYFINVVSQRVGARMYADGVRHALEVPFHAYEDQRSGETLGRLQKVRADVEKLLTATTNTLFTSLVGVLFVLIYAATVHWLIALVYLVAFPVVGTISTILSRRIKRLQKVIVAETSALAGATTESLRNIELVKSLGLVQQEGARLDKVTDKVVALELKKVRTLRALSFIQGTTVNLVRATIVFLMLYLLYDRQISIGQFFSLHVYSFSIFGPLQELGNIINLQVEAEVSLRMFEEFLRTPKEPRPDSPHPLGPLEELQFQGVSFQHASAAQPALTGIDFRAARGETIAFVGPSAAGKSTLAKLLVGLYRPRQGQILYNGAAHDTVDLESLRERIGLVTQDTQLFSGTIRENLLFVRAGASDEECLAALRRSACDSLLARAARGLDTAIGEGGLKLSGGEKQRLSIARALLRQPELLVFDEATSALDSLTEREVTSTIRAVASERRAITILIAHRLSTVMHASRIYVIERGQLVEQGQHDDLLEQRGLYYAMWRQQVGAVPAAPRAAAAAPPSRSEPAPPSEPASPSERPSAPAASS